MMSGVSHTRVKQVEQTVAVSRRHAEQFLPCIQHRLRPQRRLIAQPILMDTRDLLSVRKADPETLIVCAGA
jgi:hypothetical protein